MEKDVAHAAIDIFRINQKIGFEVILKASEVEIDRAGRDEIIVDNHSFGMKHARGEKIYLNTGLETIVDIGTAAVTEKN